MQIFLILQITIISYDKKHDPSLLGPDTNFGLQLTDTANSATGLICAGIQC